MDIFYEMAAAGHEQLVFHYDRATGLKALIALHDTRRGPALGGCRSRNYSSESEAITDALRLSRAMTGKFAVLDLPYGGGKTVIFDLGTRGREEAMKALGRAIETLRGRYGTGEDVGTSPQDMGWVAETTDHVWGTPEEKGGDGNPGPATAAGVLGGIVACLEEQFGSPEIEGRRFAVQGLGNVGFELAKSLAQRGGRVSGCDLDRDRVTLAAQTFRFEPIDLEPWIETPCDVLCPCALGNVLNPDSVPRIQAKIVAGAANNQLADEESATLLERRGILWAPDFVMNSGAALFLTTEVSNPEIDKLALVEARIGSIVKSVLQRARRSGVSPRHAAAALIAEKFEGKSGAPYVGQDKIEKSPLLPSDEDRL